MSMPPGPAEPDPYATPPSSVPQHAVPPAVPPVPPVPKPSYAGVVDPLVPAASDFSSWWAKVQEVGRRSWRSALWTTGLGIAVPLAIAALIRNGSGYTFGFSFLGIGSYFDLLGSILLGAVVTLVAYIGVAFVASAGWAAGTWALVQEAATGQPADIRAAFQYGMKRAGSLWLWAVVAGAANYVGSACPPVALYLAFAMSMFGFVAIFERGQSPLGRSFRLTHADFGPSLGKILLTFVPYLVLSLVAGFIFGVVALAIAFGSHGGFGYNVSFGVVQAIGVLIGSLGLAGMLIGLLPTYAQLRRLETPVTTAQLHQELGG